MILTLNGLNHTQVNLLQRLAENSALPYHNSTPPVVVEDRTADDEGRFTLNITVREMASAPDGSPEIVYRQTIDRILDIYQRFDRPEPECHCGAKLICEEQLAWCPVCNPRPEPEPSESVEVCQPVSYPSRHLCPECGAKLTMREGLWWCEVFGACKYNPREVAT